MGSNHKQSCRKIWRSCRDNSLTQGRRKQRQQHSKTETGRSPERRAQRETESEPQHFSSTAVMADCVSGAFADHARVIRALGLHSLINGGGGGGGGKQCRGSGVWLVVSGDGEKCGAARRAAGPRLSRGHADRTLTAGGAA